LPKSTCCCCPMPVAFVQNVVYKAISANENEPRSLPE
jgi:hypothetical protein